ncbi:ENTH-domain-containing protein [Durotheca rogersii]|uniref:ENTH-domain-containing protein n=1 Tax=Durotheca rogersii TaxID=419775 RepID=UPI0022210898|nr:ENTH-domain-containing protein [Durotheca rogersii]KAI5866357.1 ENTH-domain-containing protein [Durotheca rogersii]
MSKVMRSVKNVTKGYSSVQVKVREATSNDPWGPTGSQMTEIAQLSFNSSTEFYDIVDMLDKRLNDKGKNWRHVLKALKVLDYCLHEGSELVVTWARKNIYIIKTLREFVYVDEEGRDVGQNVRVAAKELTALLLDEERLRAERAGRAAWKSRVTGIDEYPDGPTAAAQHGRHRPRQYSDDEEDAEYKLALEASKYQEEEDRRKRESRQGVEEEDDDLAKAIKLSKEEDERRKRELEESNAKSLFDDSPAQPNTHPTGLNMGYQQGSNVDWLGNPIDQSQMTQPQPTGYVNNTYTGYPANGYTNGYNNGFNPQQTGMYDPYGQQPNHLQPQLQPFQMQPTGYNPYAGQPQFQHPQPTASPEPTLQPGSNNPWASNNQAQSALRPMPTGSNNPFATNNNNNNFTRPQTAKASLIPSLSSLQSLPEQKSLQAFSPQPQPQPQLQLQPSFNPNQQPPRQLSEHEQKLNALLASGDGMDTFGNTGELRIPAQHTAPGTFVNSAGAGAHKLTADATGNNPFLRQQFTGMPTVSYGAPQMPAATGPVGFGGYGGGSNPFATRSPQQPNNGQGQDLIQF